MNLITALKIPKLSMTPLVGMTQITTVASALQSNVICFVAYASLLPSALTVVWQLGTVPAPVWPWWYISISFIT